MRIIVFGLGHVGIVTSLRTDFGQTGRKKTNIHPYDNGN